MPTHDQHHWFPALSIHRRLTHLCQRQPSVGRRGPPLEIQPGYEFHFTSHHQLWFSIYITCICQVTFTVLYSDIKLNIDIEVFNLQMFHLIPTPRGSFAVQNDIFRLNYGWIFIYFSLIQIVNSPGAAWCVPSTHTVIVIPRAGPGHIMNQLICSFYFQKKISWSFFLIVYLLSLVCGSN